MPTFAKNLKEYLALFQEYEKVVIKHRELMEKVYNFKFDLTDEPPKQNPEDLVTKQHG